MADPTPQRDHEIVGDLRRLVTRLSEPELLLMRQWLEEELRLLKSPQLRLLRTPSGVREPIKDFNGSFAELAGAVRRRLHELPEDRLIQLRVWVLGKLRQDFGFK